MRNCVRNWGRTTVKDYQLRIGNGVVEMVALNFIIPADGIAYFNMGQGITLSFIFGRIAAPAGITPKLVEN